MRHHILNPIGVEVTDLPLVGVDSDGVAQLEELLSEHGVAVFGGQELDDAEFISFLARFGDLMFSVGETPVAGFPDLNVISNVGRKTPPRSVFHVDTSYISRPPTYTALRAVQIPSRAVKRCSPISTAPTRRYPKTSVLSSRAAQSVMLSVVLNWGQILKPRPSI